MQATDALMEQQVHSTGPITSWMTSFAEWAENSTDYRCGGRFVNACWLPATLIIPHIKPAVAYIDLNPNMPVNFMFCSTYNTSSPGTIQEAHYRPCGRYGVQPGKPELNHTDQARVVPEMPRLVIGG